MTRRHLSIVCGDDLLAATLDGAAGNTGLLWVSGGNETRAGAFSGQALLASRLAAAGYPVFRFDRRGVGESSGENLGFRESGDDIAAALIAFRHHQPGLLRVAAFGNCDAASALMLVGGAGCDALLLANPWTIDDENSVPPPAAIRARYAEKLRNPAEMLRLVSGKVSLGKLARGLAGAIRRRPAPTSLAQDIAVGVAAFGGPVRILLAERDRTAQMFAAGWDANDGRVHRCSGAGHSFGEPDAREWLFHQISNFLEN